MPPRAAECYFSAKHFVLFELDAYGRIPIVHFFQWAMRKNELMRTRAELELYDSGGDGWLTENDLQQYVEDLLPRLPALTGLLEAFVHFYKARPLPLLRLLLWPPVSVRPLPTALTRPATTDPPHPAHHPCR